MPKIGRRGRLTPRRSFARRRYRGGALSARAMQSLAVTEVATIRMRTWFFLGEGRSTSATRRTSGGPQAVHRMAFIWGANTVGTMACFTVGGAGFGLRD